MRHRHVILMLATLFAVDSFGNRAAARRQRLLPTPQRVAAVGKEVTLGLFPAGIALSADGRYVLATNNGFIMQSLSVVDTQTLAASDRRLASTGSNVLFIGVALAPDGRTGYASGHDL